MTNLVCLIIYGGVVEFKEFCFKLCWDSFYWSIIDELYVNYELIMRSNDKSLLVIYLLSFFIYYELNRLIMH